MIERNKEGQFDFPSAKELLANITDFHGLKIKQCKAYIEEELERIKNTVDLTQTRSILISSKKDFDNDMLLACVKEIMHGKGFDIYLTSDSRALGVVLKW